jgi:hypothetical protein
VYLVGFTVEIYYDAARSYKRQISELFVYLCPAVYRNKSNSLKHEIVLYDV